MIFIEEKLGGRMFLKGKNFVALKKNVHICLAKADKKIILLQQQKNTLQQNYNF